MDDDAKTFTHSEQINEIAAALAKAQSGFRGAEKDQTNPHFRSKYSSLDALWGACRQGLSENGIAVIQAPNGDENLKLTTMLVHSSGQWFRYDITAGKRGTPQSEGSLITYHKRYSLSGGVGVCSGDDDDGNAAQEHAKKSPAPLPASRPLEKPPGYADFYKKIGLEGKTNIHMSQFVEEICGRSGKSETQIVCEAMQNEAGFYDCFERWLAQKS